jgi:sulfur transfer protein SufE
VNGRPIADVATLSDDVLDRMGLVAVLGMMRARGLRAIVARVKRGFAQCAATSG